MFKVIFIGGGAGILMLWVASKIAKERLERKENPLSYF